MLLYDQLIKTLRGLYNEIMQDIKEQELDLFKKAYNHKASEQYPKARATCVTNFLAKARNRRTCQMKLQYSNYLDDLKRPPDLLNVKIGQGQL